jgi:hypothetical protein
MGTRQSILYPQFVEYMPDDKDLKEGFLYVSMPFGVAIHLCCCGCGNKVVTPFMGPEAWTLDKEGALLSLSPSIGNFNFQCKSHYFIKKNCVQWA